MRHTKGCEDPALTVALMAATIREVNDGSAQPSGGLGQDQNRKIEAGGWDAYEVWRRFFKEARERRKREMSTE